MLANANVAERVAVDLRMIENWKSKIKNGKWKMKIRSFANVVVVDL